MSEPPRVAAYLDVDGTLTTGVTLFELLRFDAAERGADQEAAAFLRDIATMREAGVTRTERNRHYFTWWAGRSVGDVVQVGRRWFASAGRGGVLRPQVVSIVERHRRAGHVVVLVSGSFAPALAPLAKVLGGAHLLVTDPEVREGRFTGCVAVPMIGEAKASAVAEHARREGISLPHSAAYGDDLSDAGYMGLTGHPTVVAVPGAPLAVVGGRRGWGLVAV
ncbi:HAD-IB family hydrolase [Oerskovia turbata]|uniref:HAD-IB family hydrolase n=1 Tax=Oerskovia turbata TaxID=1713 RepID=A0A4Q1KUH4_9CELL|nr:HAD-IB family hydrolase [Oerskovia turbata]RXR25458.1 HAD-IB family hydrolase [Oerskovia turbata]RXR33901.1 HAD-IB family hydrolase [Oerskovia turbata]TGJ95713.1 HAD-IB family hydrolase [Actinotalea fermentans ATCC 43279 = JCM 9966 = DSM 3133]